MNARRDYSGPFDPNFEHSQFARETLLELLSAYAEYILRIDGFWYLAVMEKWGNDAAFDTDLSVWKRGQMYELKTFTEAFNLHGNDVATVMKYMQVNPWLNLCRYSIDLKNNDHAILTKYTCPTLSALEKEGKGRERIQCGEITPWTFNTIAHYFNPAIKVRPIRIPPRTDYHDICCQWEFKLER